MILYPPQLLQDLNRATLFLDTNVFSAAARNEEFLNLLVDLKNEAECALTTIPSVVFEVTNGSSTLEIYNERADFVSIIVGAVDPLHFLNTITDFSVVMAKINASNKAYTDFLLAACLYHYKHVKAFLVTKDLRALPTFFDRTHIITLDEKSGDVKNFGVYKFNEESYTKAASSILTM